MFASGEAGNVENPYVRWSITCRRDPNENQGSPTPIVGAATNNQARRGRSAF